jgi:hypothetical protein
MKHVFFTRNVRQTLCVSVIALILSLLNISRIFYSALYVPADSTYLAVGHYYEDYFEYVQQIAQGGFGHTQVENQFTVSDETKTIVAWGSYLVIGKVASSIGLSPFFAYWASVFIFSYILFLVLFYLIRNILPGLPFYFQVLTLLLGVLAVPFVHSVTFAPFIIQFYDYWYAPITLFQRIGAVPHHMISSIATGLTFLVFVRLTKQAFKKDFHIFTIDSFFLTVLILLVLVSSPLHAITLVTSISTVGVILFFRIYRNKVDQTVARSFLFSLLFPFIIFGLTAVYLKFSQGTGQLFERARMWESLQNHRESALRLILTIGPIIIFIPFGIIRFIKSVSVVRLTLLAFVFFSYLYYLSPCAYLLGTFNQRFLLTPYIYVVFSCISVEYIYGVMKREGARKILIQCVVALVFFYFILGTLITNRSFFNSNAINYLPNNVIEGITQLQRTHKKAVLTSPYSTLGMIVPILVDRNVYIGRTIFTPDLEAKQIVANAFYQHQFSNEEAEKFLIDNTIGYILLASSDPYSVDSLRQYPFLTEFYKNDDITIYSYER